jgi:hypothetical protein
MPGTWDASIKRLYFADDKTDYTADTLEVGKDYDLVADIEIGASLNGFAGGDRLVITVTNLTTNAVVETKTVPRPLTPVGSVRREQVTVDFGPLDGVKVSDGDVLRATCSYRVSAGVNSDYDTAQSGPAIAVSP